MEFTYQLSPQGYFIIRSGQVVHTVRKQFENELEKEQEAQALVQSFTDAAQPAAPV